MPVDVLLVDDDAVQGATRKAILERVGLSVKIATEGTEALQFAESCVSTPFRIVITDHLMPGMDGPTFVRKLREARFIMPVLVLSGYADVEEEYESLDVVFRVKPLPPDQLIALIQYLLAGAERLTA